MSLPVFVPCYLDRCGLVASEGSTLGESPFRESPTKREVVFGLVCVAKA